MTNDQKKIDSGTGVAIPLRQSYERLCEAGANSNREIPAESVPLKTKSSIESSLAAVLKACGQQKSESNCNQVLWLSFFFDGTGNNLDADVDSLKHSNVAKLYRLHMASQDGRDASEKQGVAGKSVYRFYIPGVGTYFKDIGDPGGTPKGLAFGDLGDKRILWALRAFDKAIKNHLAMAKNPANRIAEINIAAFGFSRGAAIARAFINDLLDKLCKIDSSGNAILLAGNCRLRIRFLGLFDTVASAGFAMSANNMEKIDAAFGEAKSHIEARLAVHHETRATHLAFDQKGLPGADPAPGRYNGHAGYGDRILVSPVVEEVRHFIGAHEIRNSFPVDSISVMGENGNFRVLNNHHEYVFPGVHSDVGGSYRPGEGGKNEDPSTKLGLIPLKMIYDFAIAAGVPMLPECAWSKANKDDLSTSPELISDFKYYMSQSQQAGLSVGELFNAHMRLYYGWKFQSIAKKRAKDRTEAERIGRFEKVFHKEGTALQKRIAQLEFGLQVALEAVGKAEQDVISRNDSNSFEQDATAISLLRRNVDEKINQKLQAEDKLLREKAKLAALPKMEELPSMIALYDEQLMSDVQKIYDVILHPREISIRRGFKTSMQSLRPHYKVLVEAYLHEFIQGKGLRDQKIIDFFDKYVHDSLAGFGMDATLPSDPRVIYVGNDVKLRYAVLDSPDVSNSSSSSA